MNISAEKTRWDIRSEGRAWDTDEAMARYLTTPHKIEMIDGKLLDSAVDRENLFCLLLENIGANRAVQFGDRKMWLAATARLKG